MGLKIEYPDGATPLDADDLAALIPSQIATQGQLNEWEYANVLRAEEWLARTTRSDILETDFLLLLHEKMFGDTWRWAGSLRTKDTLPVGTSPEKIRIELTNLLEDVKVQVATGSMDITEIAARYHHRLVYIHPFPNGNGRFSRLAADVVLVRNGHERFKWGENLGQEGDARSQYIAALQAADKWDCRRLFELLGVVSR